MRAFSSGSGGTGSPGTTAEPVGTAGAAGTLPCGSALLGRPVAQGGRCHPGCDAPSAPVSMVGCHSGHAWPQNKAPTATVDREQARVVVGYSSQCLNTPPSFYQNQRLTWNINRRCHLPRLRVAPSAAILKQRDVPHRREDRPWMPHRNRWHCHPGALSCSPRAGRADESGRKSL